MADGEGFEPSIELPRYGISSAAPSAGLGDPSATNSKSTQHPSAARPCYRPGADAVLVFGIVIVLIGLAFLARSAGSAANARQFRSSGAVILVAGVVILVIELVIRAR